MNRTGTEHPYQRHILVSGVLALVGLLTALAYTLKSTPYTMIAFLTLGQGLIMLAAGLFLYAMIRDIRARLESVVEKKFSTGEIIFRQGDQGDRVYVISEGQVDVIREDAEKGEIPLARLGPNEYFGEMALLSDAPRNATVRAATDVVALTIHRADFDSLYAHVPELRQKIKTLMKQRQA